MKRVKLLVVMLALPLAGCGSGKTQVVPPPATPTTTTAGAAPTGLKGCEAFTTQAAANTYLKQTPVARSLLDSNGNGVACEAKFGSPKARSVTPRATTRSTSPRTGTRRSSTGCAQAAMAAGRFDPSCTEYQGYLDPGTSAGRAPSSGEMQYAYGCQQGYIPKSQCTASQLAGKPGGQG